MSTSIRHFKLVTGEEVICEVLEETGDTIVVNNAMSLMQNTLKNGDKFFTFKTFMVYQDTPMNVIIIFTDKILSLATPTKEMTDQYSMAIEEMAKYIEETYTDSSNEEMSLDEFLDDMDKETRLIDSDVTGMVSN
jgi:hypothetical protein